MNKQWARDILNNPLWEELHEKRLAELLSKGMDVEIPEDQSKIARLLYHELKRERHELEWTLRNASDE